MLVALFDEFFERFFLVSEDRADHLLGLRFDFFDALVDLFFLGRVVFAFEVSQLMDGFLLFCMTPTYAPAAS